MLTNGVERVIEQLVNPKILHIIKPKIDEVICKQLGIDPEKRKEHVEQSKQQHMEKMQNMQSLMNVNVTPGLFFSKFKKSEVLIYLHIFIIEFLFWFTLSYSIILFQRRAIKMGHYLAHKLQSFLHQDSRGMGGHNKHLPLARQVLISPLGEWIFRWQHHFHNNLDSACHLKCFRTCQTHGTTICSILWHLARILLHLHQRPMHKTLHRPHKQGLPM